jgi:hypothetical protein
MEPSEAHAKWKRSNRCPFCRKWTIYVNDYVNGEKVHSLTLSAPKDPSAMSECPKCGQRWFAWRQATQAEVVEEKSEMQVVAEQAFVLDNSRGLSPLVRTKTVVQEWTQAIAIDSEEAESVETGFQVGKKDVATLTSMVSNAVKTTYQLSQELRRTYTEELRFEVPPGVKRTVTLRFRRDWRCGVVRMRDEQGEASEIPFRVSAALEMDIAQDDVS